MVAVESVAEDEDMVFRSDFVGAHGLPKVVEANVCDLTPTLDEGALLVLILSHRLVV